MDGAVQESTMGCRGMDADMANSDITPTSKDIPAGEALARFLEEKRARVITAILDTLQPSRARLVRPELDNWLSSTCELVRGQGAGVYHWVARMVNAEREIGHPPEVLFREVTRLRAWFLDTFREAFGDVPFADVVEVVTSVQDTYIDTLVEVCCQVQEQLMVAERRRYASIAEAVDRPCVALDAEGRITTANAHFAALVELTGEALIGRPLVELCAEDAAVELRKALRQRRGTGTRNFAGNLKSARNTSVPVAFAAVPMFDVEGRRDGLAVALRNLAEGDGVPLHEQVVVFEGLSNVLKVAFEILDRACTVEYTSMYAQSLAPGAECVTRALLRAGGVDDAAVLRQVCEGREVWQGALRCELGDEPRWLLGVIGPQRAEINVVTRVFAIFQDITEQRILEQRILEQQRTSLASQLAVTVAHQLRNPLGVMIGYAEMMSSGIPYEQIPGAVERVLRNGLRCKRIVEDLLEFGQGLPGPRVGLELNAFLREAVLPHVARPNGPPVAWQLATSPCTVTAVPPLLAQVFVNLIENAERAARSSVTVKVEAGSDRVRVRVIDDGDGVPEEIRPHLFDPFFTTHRDTGAVGLGLSLALHAVQDIGGRLILDVEHAGGACFVVDLPIAKGEIAGTTPFNTPMSPKPSRRILIVDDELDLLELLKAALMPLNFEVHTAGNGAEALQLLERHAYDGCVLDVQLPGDLTGPQLFQYIRGARPELVGRSLFITADTMNFETRRFLQETGCPHLEKPFLVTQFLKRVEGIFGGRKSG
jgi:PAS domain S-box-containing protein